LRTNVAPFEKVVVRNQTYRPALERDFDETCSSWRFMVPAVIMFVSELCTPSSVRTF